MVDERVHTPSYKEITNCVSLVCLSASTRAHLCHRIILISMEISINFNFTIQLILIMKFASLFPVLSDICNFFNEIIK